MSDMVTDSNPSCATAAIPTAERIACEGRDPPCATASLPTDLRVACARPEPSCANALPSVQRAVCAPPAGAYANASLPTGHRVVCTTPEVPGVRDYVVLHLEPTVQEPGAELLAALVAHAHAVARALSMERFGHAEGWSLLVNGSATRRTRGVHVHVVLSDSLRAKRRAFAWLQLKHLTRPLVRVFRTLRRDHVLASG